MYVKSKQCSMTCDRTGAPFSIAVINKGVVCKTANKQKLMKQDYLMLECS